MVGAALLLALFAANSLPSGSEVVESFATLGDADLVFMSNPAGDWPVRVLLATRVSAATEKVQQVIRDPASFASAMPSFRHVRVVAQEEREPGILDTQVAWELEIPLRNLKGKLWLKPEPGGVDLVLSDGDFAPGMLQVRARSAMDKDRRAATLLTVEGSANVRDINWATRKIVQRSALAEPAITAAALFVMTKALATLAEGKGAARPTGAMVAPSPSRLEGSALGAIVAAKDTNRSVWVSLHNRADGRLAHVQVAVPVAAPSEKAQGHTLRPTTFAALPGWRRLTLANDKPDECKDLSALCWRVDNDLPVFSLSGTWKIWPRPWRARMVAGETAGAVMAIDVKPAISPGQSVLVLSQHPRLDQAGFVARKLIAAEPFLEQGLALALTLVDAVALAQALEHEAVAR